MEIKITGVHCALSGKSALEGRAELPPLPIIFDLSSYFIFSRDILFSRREKICSGLENFLEPYRLPIKKAARGWKASLRRWYGGEGTARCVRQPFAGYQEISVRGPRLRIRHRGCAKQAEWLLVRTGQMQRDGG